MKEGTRMQPFGESAVVMRQASPSSYDSDSNREAGKSPPATYSKASHSAGFLLSPARQAIYRTRYMQEVPQIEAGNFQRKERIQQAPRHPPPAHARQG